MKLTTPQRIALSLSVFVVIVIVLLVTIINIVYLSSWYREGVLDARFIVEDTNGFVDSVGGEMQEVATLSGQLEDDVATVYTYDEGFDDMFIDQAVVESDSIDRKAFSLVTHLLPYLYTDGVDYYILVESGGRTSLLFVSEQWRIQRQMAWYSLGVSLLFFVLVYGGSRYLARRSLRDVDTIALHAQQISLDTLDQDLQIDHLPQHDVLQQIVTAINSATSSLSDQVQVIRRFVSHVSHEFRTPMTVMQSQMQLASHTQDYARAMPRIQSAMENMQRLLDTLLLLTHYQHAQEWEVERIDVVSLIQDQIAMMQIKYEKKQLTLIRDLPGSHMIQAHRGAAEVIIHNLIDNAYKFSPLDGQIRIHVDPRALTIMDSGDGMSANQMEHMFDPFRQADTSRQTQGFGLGLYLVHELTQLQGREVQPYPAPTGGLQIELVWTIEGSESL